MVRRVSAYSEWRLYNYNRLLTTFFRKQAHPPESAWYLLEFYSCMRENTRRSKNVCASVDLSDFMTIDNVNCDNDYQQK